MVSNTCLFCVLVSVFSSVSVFIRVDCIVHPYYFFSQYDGSLLMD